MVRFTTIVLAVIFFSGCCKEEVQDPCDRECGILRQKTLERNMNTYQWEYTYTVDLNCTGERVYWMGYSAHLEDKLLGDQLCKSEVW